MMQKRTLQIGIIGCGMIADWHASAIAALADGMASAMPILAGAADRDAARTEAFANKHGVHAYPTIDDLLADDGIDAVCICTPNGTHAALTLTALAHGKHVLIEKPMALSVDDCDRIMAEAAKRRLCVGVISQRRFSETMRAVSRVLREGRLGVLVSAELSLRYYRDATYYAKGGWHGSRAMDGGVLMNQGAHGVDILLHLMGEAEQVYAFCANRVHDIDAEDTVCATVRFRNGALGTIHATTASAPGFPQTLTISGEKGSITLTENEIGVWDVPDVPKPTVGGLSAGGFGKAENIALDGHIAQLGDFMDAIAEERAPRVGANAGRRVVSLIRAIYESAERGEPVYTR